MAKRLAFDGIFKTEFRWPTKGDTPFVVALDGLDNAIIFEDERTRLAVMTSGYKKSADLAVIRATDYRADRDFLVYPILFNYRQFLELSLKYHLASYGYAVGIDPNWTSHDLGVLWDIFEEMLDRYGVDDPDKVNPTVKRVVAEFAKIDPDSYSYRYPVDRKGKPVPVVFGVMDLQSLADVINAVAGYFTGCDGYLDSLRSSGPG